MDPEKNTESEDILDFRFSSNENEEGDFSYNEAIMDESMGEFLKEVSTAPRWSFAMHTYINFFW